MKLLITGGSGFIGSHFVHYFCTKHDLVILDCLNYASDYDRIRDLRNSIPVYYHDLRSPIPDTLREKVGDVDYIIHLAAETHVDRSMVDPQPFIESNILGTYNLLEYARLYQPKLKMFFYISTDESYGPAPLGVDHSEDAPHKPSNPYSATKAAAEDLCFAWNHSMGVPIIITNTMNNIGEGQYPEKFVPKIIKAIQEDGLITIHGSPDEPGSRKYLYARDHADAIDFLIVNGRRGEKYNVVGKQEVNNLELVVKLEQLAGKEVRKRFIDFHATRPGHDKRYSLSGEKMKNLGWEPPTDIDSALKQIWLSYSTRNGPA